MDESTTNMSNARPPNAFWGVKWEMKYRSAVDTKVYIGGNRWPPSGGDHSRRRRKRWAAATATARRRPTATNATTTTTITTFCRPITGPSKGCLLTLLPSRWLASPTLLLPPAVLLPPLTMPTRPSPVSRLSAACLTLVANSIQLFLYFFQFNNRFDWRIKLESFDLWVLWWSRALKISSLVVPSIDNNMYSTWAFIY